MRFAISALWLAGCAAHAAGPPYFAVLSENPGPWPQILSSVGFQQQPPSLARIFVLRGGALASAEWTARVEGGAVLVLEGESRMAEMFGFRRSKENVRASSVEDIHNPKLPIVWQVPLEMPVYEVPPGATVFARERWTGAPLVAGMRRGQGALLWLALEPGERGYERFPYLLQALGDLGAEPPFRSSRLWAFFDYSYRVRVDLDYFAARWRKAGIAALHVAAWHFYESDPERDRYLKALIEACHKRGILVYAWLELPHVSEKFWNDHPEWREKTAILQDAHLDWRRLMNLANRDCFRAVSSGVSELITRFDWDGVNLAELYFESIEGAANPSRFTPMNRDVRAAFRDARGFDPIELFGARTSAADLRAFLDFRADLANRMQLEWLEELEKVRRARPHLDLVLTHVDDRFDSGMRDAIGADAARALPLLDRFNFTFLVEDPATVWHLGAQRYAEIARRYAGLTARSDKLAVDLNIVERYQDVYPTRQQTGVELFQLVQQASRSFPRVALYFENSILAPDLNLLPASASSVTRFERIGSKVVLESSHGAAIPWTGPAMVDGREWPLLDGTHIWLPAGAHAVEPGRTPATRALVTDFNGTVQSARYRRDGAIEIAYQSSARAVAVLDRIPQRLSVDGAPAALQMAGLRTVLLPRGQHLVVIETD